MMAAEKTFTTTQGHLVIVTADELLVIVHGRAVRVRTGNGEAQELADTMIKALAQCQFLADVDREEAGS
jgi:hypothetical protein